MGLIPFFRSLFPLPRNAGVLAVFPVFILAYGTKFGNGSGLSLNPSKKMVE